MPPRCRHGAAPAARQSAVVRAGPQMRVAAGSRPSLSSGGVRSRGGVAMTRVDADERVDQRTLILESLAATAAAMRGVELQLTAEVPRRLLSDAISELNRTIAELRRMAIVEKGPDEPDPTLDANIDPQIDAA